MNFVLSNPGMLWGLAAIALPVAIHLLMRRKPVVEHWGATRFLKSVLEKKKSQLHVQSYSHLVIRMLILAFLVLAATDPRSDSSIASVNSNENVHRLLIVDLTMSMEVTENDETRLDKVRRQITELISRSSSGDSWQLLVHGTQDSPVRLRVPVYESSLILDEVTKLSVKMRTGNWSETLRRAISLVDEFPGTSNEIFIWTDLAVQDWEYKGSEEYEMNALFERLGDVSKVSLIDVAKHSVPNISVNGLKVHDKNIRVGDRVDIEAKVKSFSAVPSDVTAELFVNKERVTEKSIVLDPFETKAIDFQAFLMKPGVAECEVVLNQDSLNADNYRGVAFEVKQTTNVLIIEDENKTGVLQQSDYLSLALTSESLTKPDEFNSSSKYRVSVMTPAELGNHPLQGFDVLIVCGLKEISQVTAQRLSEFVNRGGGILFTMGDEISLRDYNTQLGKSGKGLLPFDMNNRVSIDAEMTPFQIGKFVEKHPMVEPFLRHPSAGLQTTRIYSYIAIDDEEEVDGLTILALDNGAPLLLSPAQRSGEVVLVTTAFNTRWGSWVLWPSFLPMVQRLVDDLATRDSLIINSIIGKGIEEEILESMQFHEIVTPSGEVISEDESFLQTLDESYENVLSEAGFYALNNHDLGSTMHVIVRNVDTSESDLRHVKRSELLASSLFKGLDVSVLEEAARSAFQRRGIASEGDAHLSRWLLFAAVLLAVVDQLYLIHPVAAVGALLGGGIGSVLAHYAVQSPLEKIVFIVACAFAIAFLAKQYSEKMLNRKPSINNF